MPQHRTLVEIATTLLNDHDRSIDRGGDNTLTHAIIFQASDQLKALVEDSNEYWQLFDQTEADIRAELTRIASGTVKDDDVSWIIDLADAGAIGLTQTQTKVITPGTASVPEGWTQELYEAVSTGEISYRRAHHQLNKQGLEGHLDILDMDRYPLLDYSAYRHPQGQPGQQSILIRDILYGVELNPAPTRPANKWQIWQNESQTPGSISPGVISYKATRHDALTALNSYAQRLNDYDIKNGILDNPFPGAMHYETRDQAIQGEILTVLNTSADSTGPNYVNNFDIEAIADEVIRYNDAEKAWVSTVDANTFWQAIEDHTLTGTAPQPPTEELPVLYTADGCPGCDLTQKAFTNKGLREGIDYEVVNLTQNPDIAEQFKAQGYTSAPILKDAKGEITAGFNPSRIQAIIQAANAGKTAKTGNAGDTVKTGNAVKTVNAGVTQQAPRKSQ